jgi:hypothetical protein
MTTIEGFFRSRGVAVDETMLVEALDQLLGDRVSASGAVPLTAGEIATLEAHSGVRPRPRDEGQAVAATAAVATDLVARSATVADVAARAGVSASRVRHWIAERRIVALRVGGRNLLPDWQFGADGRPLPHLAEILLALPEDLHPLSLAGFFSTPQPELAVEGRALDAAEWLSAGGDPSAVVALAEGLRVLL